MPVNVLQWRAGIGNFYNYTHPQIKIINVSHSFFNIRSFSLGFFYNLFFNDILMQHGDIELNPGPFKKSKPLTCCHWNVNSLTAHKFTKKSSIEAYNSIHNYDFICISETFFDSSISSDDEDIAIKDYSIIRADHPSNLKQGGVCIYYKESLAVESIDINFLNECILCEVTLDKLKGYITVLYRSPSQNSSEFDNFLSGFENILNLINSFKPDFSIILGDFNGRSKSWWQDDINNDEGTKIDALTSYHGLHQLISEPTHILANSSSCIDLIFTDQPNLVTDCGVHPSLHPNCHHQIIYCKLNLNIVYPPPYRRLVWDFKRANIDAIREAIKTVAWHYMFLNKTVHEQVAVFNNILLNIFTNYTPHKNIIVDDRDPPWMTKRIKDKINLKSTLYKSKDFIELQNLSSEISEMISVRKEEYYLHLSEKLNNPNTSSKTYWSILKSFYKGNKVPLIPPLLVNNKFVSDFTKKANLFNDFFASQCTPLSNNSTLPKKYFLTEKRLITIDFNKDDILKIIRNLNVNKAHGHDEISIRMLKICDSAVTEPLSILFKNCIGSGIFPNIWKMSHIIPTHKKNDKCLINNYRPVSLLPICSKIFERIIYNPVFLYLENNNLLTPNQSGFRPNDSCVNQLLSIVHKIYSDFDECPSLEVRSNFLDISKAFDKVWHEGLIFKLETIGISGNLLKLFESFLSNRQQRVVLNGQHSIWAPVLAGVPQGSILGPILFLIYINDLPNNLESLAKLFADDTSLFSTVYNPYKSAKLLNDDLLKISDWAYKWKMLFNPDVTKQAQEVIFSRKSKKTDHPVVYFNNAPVAKASCQKHLGMHLDEKLSFNTHIKEKIAKANKGIGIIRKLAYYLPRQSLITIYKSFVRPHVDYGDIIYDQPNNEQFCNMVERVQYNAALAITGAIKGTSQQKIYNELGFESLRFRRWFRRLCVFYKIKATQLPSYLYDLIPKSNHNYNTRNIDHIDPYFCRTDVFKYSFFPYTIVEWNKLDANLKNAKSYMCFRNSLLKIGRPVQNSIFKIFNPLGIKFLTRLRLGLSHLNKHRFRHNFQNCLNPLCSCMLEVESTTHFFLHCRFYDTLRQTLLDTVVTIIQDFSNLSDDLQANHLMFGSPSYSFDENNTILNASIRYILDTNRFSGPLI